KPQKEYNIGGLTVTPFKPTYKGLITPAIIYNQNKNITDVPEEQLTKVFPTPVSLTTRAVSFHLFPQHLDNIVIGDGEFGPEIKYAYDHLAALFNKSL